MRFKLLVIAVLFSNPIRSQAPDPVKIYQEPSGDGGFQYFAQNIDLAPYQLEISFSELNNLKASVDLPYYTVVYPGDPVPLFRLDPVVKGSTSFKSGYKLTLGDPEAATESDFIYWLPFEAQQGYTMVQGANGSSTHQDKYAWDFAMEEGTKVCASRNGLVIQIKEDSNVGGADISFMEHANRITVLHDDGSYADYVHLKHNGALVETGDHVVSGQLIGYSGNTGWSTKPHLHFQVYKAVRFGIRTLPARFLTRSGIISDLQEQVTYQAVHR
jgi:murein DD-endopeptidase MepM/ murein hydrolase activator NlpD